MHRFSTRNLQPELMDQPELDATRHEHALRGLATINFLSGSVGILWPTVKRLATSMAGQPLAILDVACGGGDVTIGLRKRAQREGVPVRVAGCDKSSRAIEFARRRAAKESGDVAFFTHDALAEPLPAGYDVVVCSLFLHHLAEAQAITVLHRMAAAAGRLVLVNDLVRGATGYALAWIGTRLLTRSDVARIDGPLSVAGAFTMTEARSLAEQAELRNADVCRRWPCRFLLTWKNPRG